MLRWRACFQSSTLPLQVPILERSGEGSPGHVLYLSFVTLDGHDEDRAPRDQDWKDEDEPGPEGLLVQGLVVSSLPSTLNSLRQREDNTIEDSRVLCFPFSMRG